MLNDHVDSSPPTTTTIGWNVSAGSVNTERNDIKVYEEMEAYHKITREREKIGE